MRRVHSFLFVALAVTLVAAAWWGGWGRNAVRSNRQLTAAPRGAAPAGQGSAVAATVPAPAAAPAALGATPAGPTPNATSRPAALGGLTYAQAWSGEQPPALAAFRAWTERFLRAATAIERSALEPEGLALARTRRVALKLLIENDPRAALESTVPAALRGQLPAAIVAELETRFSAIGDFTVLAFDYGPLELIRRKQAGLSTDPFQSTVQWSGGPEYRAFVYGRRAGQTTKFGLPLHGVRLDEVVALHEAAVRVFEADETPPPGLPVIAVGTGADPSGTVLAEIGGKLFRFASLAAASEAERKFASSEAGLGPNRIPPVDTVVLGALPAAPDPGAGNAALPATAWTVGAKKILHLRVDFSDLVGEPKRGSTIYTAAYVQNLADTQVNPYYAASSYGQTTLTNTVSTKVYRLPQTAAHYATTGTGGSNTLLHTDARTAASADYTLSAYDRIIVIFSSLNGIAGSKITYAGLANVGGPYVWVNGEYDFRVAAHELGHTYGLRHANLWQVSDGNPVSATGTSTEYGDDFDTMGGNFANDQRTDFNPWFKNLLGWIADSQVRTITTNGTFRLNRFDASSATGTLALKIVRDATRSTWIGVRRSFTNNAAMTHGAYLVWGYNSTTQSNLLDLTTPGSGVADAALAIGATLLDPVGNLSIKPVAEGGTAPAEYLDLEINVGLNGLPVIATPPLSQGFAIGATINLSVAAAGTAPLAYQWTKHGADLAGATAATFVIANAQPYHAGSYAVRVTNSVGSVTSAAATLAVNAPPVIDRPPGNVIAAVGRTATFTVAASGLPVPGYQWRKAGTPIVGATAATYAIANVQTTDAGSFDVVVSNAQGALTSASVALTVNAAPGAIPANDAFVNALPLVGHAGTAHASNVGATGEVGEPLHTSAGTTASSVWFRWTPTVSGVAQIDTLGTVLDTGLAVYTGSTVTALTQLRQDDDGGAPNGGGPSLVTLSVVAGTTYSIAVGSFDADPRGAILLNYVVTAPPVITTQPVSTTAALGGAATFTVVASGTGLSYQWFRNNVALPGATSAALALGNLQSSDAGSYYVVVANSGGSVTSSTVTLTASVVAPTITTQPLAQSVAPGGSFTLTVGVTGSGPLVYQWSRNGAALAGATAASYSVSDAQLASAGRYAVTVTNAAGSATSAFAQMSLIGMLWAVGDDSSGQLGIGTLTQRPTPVPIMDGVQAVAAGLQHSFFLKTNGTLWATGLNADGQQGDGSTTERNVPTQIVTDVRAVAAGNVHSLFLKTDGTLWATGASNAGQLGTGTTVSRLAPVQVASGVSAVAAGVSHSLYLKTDGTLWAMGWNASGELGDGTTIQRNLAVQVASGVSAVAAGAAYSLYLKTDGTMWGMGDNFFGQLGDGTTTRRIAPVLVAGGVKAMATGQYHSVFVKTDGTLWTMGSNFVGQLGDGTILSRSSPIQVAQGVSAVAAGGNRSFYVKIDGTLWGMGQNACGELGDGSLVNRHLPVQVASGASAVATGGSHSFYLTTDGILWAMGSTAAGRLGDGLATSRSLGARMASGVSLVAAGGYHCWFRKSDATLWALGNNASGQLGEGTTIQRNSPVQVAVDVSDAVAGPNHSLFVKSDRTLWAMGGNAGGQLGDGTTTQRDSPVQLAAGVAAVSAGGAHSLYLKTDGTLWAVGGNAVGQLGDGTTTQRNAPVPVAAGVGALAAGDSHSVFLKTDGTLWVMGSNSSGQLGDGTTTQRNSPVQVASAVSAVAAGAFHSLYLKTDKTLWAMGRNDQGQLGDGTDQNQRTAPVQVAGGVEAVAAGGYHSLFLKADGTLWTMGNNSSGQLGDGTRSNRNLPVQVANGVSAMAAGLFSSYFIQTAGIGTPPSIGSQPAGGGYAVGAVATLTVAATGSAPLDFHWRKHGVDIPGARSATVYFPFLQTSDFGGYSVMITNSAGNVTSDPAILTVQTIAAAISTQPVSQVVAAGASATFTIAATGAPTPTYEWQRQAAGTTVFVNVANGGPYSGATSSTLTVSATTVAMRGDLFQCVASNGVGSPVTSAPVALTVNAPPAIASANTAVFTATQPGVFGVTATGAPAPTFSLAAGSLPSGVSLNATSGLISGTPSGTAGSPFAFTLTAGNGVPPVATQTFTLTVLPVPVAPVITSPPAGQVVAEGATLSLSVAATGTPTPSYQWRRNSADIAGAMSATFTRTNAQLADAGSYTVFVSNSAGSATSQSVTVSVIPAGTSARHAVVRGGYTSGGTVTLSNTLAYSGVATGASWQVLLPVGWTFASFSGSTPTTSPTAGAANLAEWTWTAPPASPVTFAYVLNVPAGATGTASLVATATVRQSGATIPLLAQPDPLVVAAASTRHAADSDGDGRISLFELTRVIELYNGRSGTTRTGSYRVDPTSEDGFGPDPTRPGAAVLTRYHTADTHRNAQFDLSNSPV